MGITKVSEITNIKLAEYLKLEIEGLTVSEIEELDTILIVAKSFVQSYTGLSSGDIDAHSEFIIVVYVLGQDMYDNRTLYVDKNNLNKVVETILGMHSINLL